MCQARKPYIIGSPEEEEEKSVHVCVYVCVRARACVWWNFAACKFQKKLKYTIQGPQLAIFQEVTFTSSMF